MTVTRATRLGLAVVALLAGGCGLPEGERVITPHEAAARIQPFLGARLNRVPRLESTNAFVDVRATYSGSTAEESVLIVIFRSAQATAQVVGQPAVRSKGLIRHRNVVVFYRHAAGTRNRARQLAASVRKL